MEERDWEMLVVLNRHKNITHTAEELYISQPSLTKKMNKIEKELGIVLYERKSRGIELTPQGEYLVKYAEDIVEQLSRIKRNVRDMNDKVIGKLKIGVSNYYAKYQLPRLLTKFKEEYPDVEFEIYSGWSKEIFSLIHRRAIHLGILRGDYIWDEESHLLFQDPLCLASMQPLDLGVLPSLPRIDYKTGTLTNSLIETWWNDMFASPPNVEITVDNMEACKEMVSKGLGYGILPRSILADQAHLDIKEIIEGNQGRPLIINTWMYYSKPLLETKIVETFVQFVKKHGTYSIMNQR